jgi:hypothetical protein
MKRYDLSPANVREYLKWKAKTDALKLARKKKRDERKAKERRQKRAVTLDDFL